MRLSLLFFSALLLGGCGGAGGTDSVMLRTRVLRGSGGCGAPIDPCPNPVTWAPYDGIGVRVVRESDKLILSQGFADTSGGVDLKGIPPGDWTLELFFNDGGLGPHRPLAIARYAITVEPKNPRDIEIQYYLPPP